MRNPEEVLPPIIAFLHSRQVTTAEITIECDCNIATLLKLGGDPLRVHVAKVRVLRVGERPSLGVLHDLVFVAALDNTPVLFLGPSARLLRLVPALLTLSWLVDRSFALVAKVYLTIIALRFDARLVPDVLRILFAVMLHVLIED